MASEQLAQGQEVFHGTITLLDDIKFFMKNNK